MTELTAIFTPLVAAFLASTVEAVEAFTIVLAVGITTGWRPALTGAALALITLAILVAVLGPALGLIPLHLLQFIIGTLLLLFGMRWLRKAILRAAGFIALHDETGIYARQTAALSEQSRQTRANYLAGIAAFKAVLLEGVEVIFIVIAIGAGSTTSLAYGAIGATAACLLVLGIGFLVRRPLSRIPENGLKFVVGILLTSFGVFWLGEGLGADWPGADLSLAAIVVVLAILALAMTSWLRTTRKEPATS